MARGALQMSLANLVDYLTQEEEDQAVPLSLLADAVAGGARQPLDLAFGEEAVTQAGQLAAATPGGVAQWFTEDIPAMAELGGDLAGAIAQPSTQRLQSGREAGVKTRNILSQVADHIQREGALGTATRGLRAMGEGMGQAMDERGFAALTGPEDLVPGLGKTIAALGMAAPLARMGKAARQADLPKEAVEEFGEQVLQKHGLADLEIYEVGDDIKISMIAVPKGQQGQGIGSAAMQDIVDFADQHGKRLILTPGPIESRWGQTSTASQKRFYKKFGFVENKGDDKDFRIKDSMYRAPQEFEAVSKAQAIEERAPQAAPKAQTLEERAAAVGYTRPAYHGSTHDIREFELNRANVENHLGQAHYFTTSPKDASENYGGMGPDLTARIRREAEQMDDVSWDELLDMVDDTVRRQYEGKMQAADARIKAAYDEETALINQSMSEHKVVAGRQVRPPGTDERLQELSEIQRKGRLEKDNIDSELLFEAAKANLKGPSEGMVYDVQLRLDNPLHIDGSKKEPVFEIETVYDDAGEFVEERGNGLDLVQAMHDAAAEFYGDAEAIVREFMEKGGDQMLDGMRASEVDSALRGLDSVYDLYDETGDGAATEFIRQVYENLGYDSVIMDPAKAFPHMGNVPTGTRHYIVFDKYANKIRSKRAAFDPKKIGSRDILATVTPIAAPGLAAGYLATREQE